MQSASYELIPEISSLPEVKKICDMILAGEFIISPDELINNIIKNFASEFMSVSRYLIIFVSMGLVGMVLGLYGKNSTTGIGSVSFYTLYAAIASIAIRCYSICLEYALNVIGEMSDFITKISPMIFTLIIASGKSISGAVFHPVLMAGVFVITVVCNKCVIPIVSYSVILSVADNMGENVKVSGFCKLLNSSAKWIMTLMFTVFTGICSVYGFTAPKLDILGVKTVKFAVGSLVPVVGGFLSETLETVVSGAGIMKNTIGVAGLVVMCSICFLPVVKIGAMALMVRLCSAITEAVSDKKISTFLNSISAAITTLFGIVATVSVLFIINISIIIGATG